MSRIEWDKTGEHFYETGVDHAVLYVLKNGRYSQGVPWNGLTAVNENSSGAEVNPFYADNIKYLNIMSSEDYSPTIEAFTYPDEYKECIGEVEIATGAYIHQQKRSHFGLSFRTLVGNDEDGTEYGYKIHLVFNAVAKSSDRSYGTVNETPDALSYSWETSTEPVLIEGYKPTSTLILESEKFRKAGIYNALKAIEDILYGTEHTNPRFPSVSDILDTYLLQIYIRDSSNNTLLDSSGNRIQSRVFE